MISYTHRKGRTERKETMTTKTNNATAEAIITKLNEKCPELTYTVKYHTSESFLIDINEKRNEIHHLRVHASLDMADGIPVASVSEVSYSRLHDKEYSRVEKFYCDDTMTPGRIARFVTDYVKKYYRL